jgi:2-methylisocitrate lyase-like PEP mutase family enzyme
MTMALRSLGMTMALRSLRMTAVAAQRVIPSEARSAKSRDLQFEPRHARAHCAPIDSSADTVLQPREHEMAPFDPRVQRFRALHESGCFVVPNPFDAGSARVLEQLGFQALATTSAGFAWTLARPDNGITIDEALTHLDAICASVRIPVSADFERGFATEPTEVARNVSRAITTGVAGLSIEDSTHEAEHPLFEFDLALERVRAARKTIDDCGSGTVLTARTEGFVVGRPDLKETIRRLTAFAEAGADCLFAPGLKSMSDIEAVVRAVAPKSVNVGASMNFASVDQLAQIGVRRISVGGGLARAAWHGVIAAAKEILESGTFATIAGSVAGAEIDARFRNGQ